MNKFRDCSSFCVLLRGWNSKLLRSNRFFIHHRARLPVVFISGVSPVNGSSILHVEPFAICFHPACNCFQTSSFIICVLLHIGVYIHSHRLEISHRSVSYAREIQFHFTWGVRRRNVSLMAEYFHYGDALRSTRSDNKGPDFVTFLWLLTFNDRRDSPFPTGPIS